MDASAYARGVESVRLDLLELLGADYLINHVAEQINAERKADIYRAYISDTLKIISENTRFHLVYTKDGAEFVEVGGKPEKHWLELANPQESEPEPEEDTRTFTEIIDQVWGAIEGTKGGG